MHIVFLLPLNPDAIEECNRLAIPISLKGKKVRRRITPPVQQNDEPEQGKGSVTLFRGEWLTPVLI
jgi:hypothetical protein